MTNDSKLALVTGASRGIGKAIGVTLLNKGYSLIGVSRTISRDQSMEALARERGLSYLAMQADITSPDDHDRIFHRISKEFGKLDVLVNNAGVAPLERIDVLEMSVESYERVMRINLEGPVFLTQRLYPLLEKAIRSSVIFITSVSAEAVSVNRAEYCMSKAGLSMFAKVMAQRLSNTGCRVFEIRPGVIDTDMISTVRDKYTELARQGNIPQRRLGKPEDIAGAVGVLVEGNFDYANGMIVEMSGGMQIRNL